MKRGIAALLMAFLLAGCGAPGGSLSAEESIDDAETVLHGETFTAENGCANLALTLPESWEGETADRTHATLSSGPLTRRSCA